MGALGDRAAAWADGRGFVLLLRCLTVFSQKSELSVNNIEFVTRIDEYPTISNRFSAIFSLSSYVDNWLKHKKDDRRAGRPSSVFPTVN